MKHDKHELTYKKFIKAEKRLNEVYKLLNKAPKIPIKEPYQNGWTLNIALREDFLKSEKGPLAKHLLDKLSVEHYTRNAKLISEIRKKPALHECRKLLYKHLKGNLYFQGPYVKSLNEREFNKLSEQEKKYFTFIKNATINAWNKESGRWEFTIPYHYLIVKVNKRMITHAKELDTALLKEKAELQSILTLYYLGGRYDYNYHYFEKRAERRESKVKLSKIDLEDLD